MFKTDVLILPRLWHFSYDYDMNGYVFPIYYTAEIFLLPSERD